MKAFLNDFRLQLDAEANLLSNIDNYKSKEFYPYSEIKAAEKSIIWAKAWCGKLASTHNSQSPYVNDGKRKSVMDIEPADASSNMPPVKITNMVEFVDMHREAIQKFIDELISTYKNVGVSKLGKVYFDQVLICLTQARMELGFALGAIRDGKSTIV